MKKILFFALISVSQALLKDEENFVHPYHRHPSPFTPGGRIIGGEDAPLQAYPYQVGMYVYTATTTDFCGGSLISPNYVLTAAHCAETALKIEVILGAHNVTAEEDTQVRLVSTEFIIHEGWNKSLLVNDIALVKLPSSVKETDAIRTIDIAAGTNQFDGESAVTTGWGVTQNSQSTVTPILKYLVSTILSNDVCREAGPNYDAIMKPSLLCLSGDGNVGTCHGDSGGPLAVDGIQVGIVSFGYPDCSAGKPSVFTRLTEYTDWIAKNSDVTLI
ncbi:hypothetical protein JTB14_001507 [Gonioctena quinquepunctata]|nr:hypothetical protein JTB14_001507 [Gonioctena quinquepunctata]